MTEQRHEETFRQKRIRDGGEDEHAQLMDNLKAMKPNKGAKSLEEADDAHDLPGHVMKSVINHLKNELNSSNRILCLESGFNEALWGIKNIKEKKEWTANITPRYISSMIPGFEVGYTLSIISSETSLSAEFRKDEASPKFAFSAEINGDIHAKKQAFHEFITSLNLIPGAGDRSYPAQEEDSDYLPAMPNFREFGNEELYLNFFYKMYIFDDSEKDKKKGYYEVKPQNGYSFKNPRDHLFIKGVPVNEKTLFTIFLIEYSTDTTPIATIKECVGITMEMKDISVATRTLGDIILNYCTKPNGTSLRARLPEIEKIVYRMAALMNQSNV